MSKAQEQVVAYFIVSGAIVIVVLPLAVWKIVDLILWVIK